MARKNKQHKKNACTTLHNAGGGIKMQCRLSQNKHPLINTMNTYHECSAFSPV